LSVRTVLLCFLVLLILCRPFVFAIDNLKLNSELNYASDGLDGPLITGDNAQSGLQPGHPNYVIIYGEGCFNSKRQARRTVELYSRYRTQVHFVVIDLDLRRSPEQQRLLDRYYKGYIPHIVVLDAHRRALYDRSGEADSKVIERAFKTALKE
jgi:hypothetical protein